VWRAAPFVLRRAPDGLRPAECRPRHIDFDSSAAGQVPSCAVACPSGLRSTPRKRVRGQLLRGFKSHRHRHSDQGFYPPGGLRPALGRVPRRGLWSQCRSHFASPCTSSLGLDIALRRSASADCSSAISMSSAPSCVSSRARRAHRGSRRGVGGPLGHRRWSGLPRADCCSTGRQHAPDRMPPAPPRARIRHTHDRYRRRSGSSSSSTDPARSGSQ
jgi:hypothetical protein